MDDVNVVAVSGTVHRIFEERMTTNDIRNRSMLVNFHRKGRDNRVYASAFGDGVDQLEELEEGSRVVVQGMLNENTWQDKESEEWKHRVEITISRVVDLDAQDGPPDE